MIITGPLTSRTEATLPSGTIPPLLVAHLQPRQVVDLLAEVGVALDVDLPGAAEPVEVVDVQRAQVDLQRVEQLGDRDAHQLGLVAVDVQVQPGRVGPEAGEEALQSCGVRLRRRRRSGWRRSRAPASPVSPRSSITILKPPAVPRPSTGGASKTLTSPSLISSWSVACSRAAITGPVSPSWARWWKSSSITYIAPKFGRVGVHQDRLAGDRHGVRDARQSCRRSPRRRLITSWVRSSDDESGSCTLTSR